MDDVRIASWNELNERLYEGSWRPELGRFRSGMAYRGMSRAGDDLRTTLADIEGDHRGRESHLLRNFRKYAHRDAVPGDSVWNWLALAQHHGLPTRLLDWTFSPYVAMHFATQNLDRFDADGVIWCVDYVQTHQLLPERLKAVLEEEDADVFTTEMLECSAHSLATFDELAGEREFVVFLEPPSLDDRIVNQFALFSLMSNPRYLMDHWLSEHPELYRRVIIPSNAKWEIRDKLDQANVTERVLFPGLDGLSRWLKRYYSPKGNGPRP